MSHVMLSYILAVSVCGGQVGEPQPPTAEELERGAMEYRRGLTSGRVVFSRILERLGRSPNEKWKWRFAMEFQGDRLRVDVVWEDRDNPENRRFEQAALIDGEYIYDGMHDEYQLVEIGKTEDQRYIQAEGNLFDPRLLGVGCIGIGGLYRMTLESFLARRDREPPKVSRDRIDGHDAWRIDYAYLRRGKKSQMWIVPEMGYAVIRHEVSQSQTTYAFVHSKYKQYGDVWYPHEVVYEFKWNGEFVDQETATVESAEFGTRIDEARFTLATFGLKPGDQVRAYGDRRTWDGQKLLAGLGPNPATAVDLTKEPAGNRLRTLFWVNAIVLALIAACLLAKYFRKQSRNSP